MEIAKIKETCLYVQNLDRTEAFYHGQLGFPVIGKVANRHVFFRAGASVLLCFIAETTRADTKLPAHFGFGHLHLAFEVKADAYEGWKKKIQESSIVIVHEQQWSEGVHSFYFRDPDDHLLEILPEKGVWE